MKMAFINVVKPTHLCNLSCKYCYNEDERKPIMDESTLYNTIKETFNYAKKINAFSVVEFIWHGGEPLIAGPLFYKKVIIFQKKLCNDIPYSNAIQTNGTLLNKKWIEFFKENNIAISLSIDGPKELHDINRIDKKGNGSFDNVMHGVQLLRDAKLKFGCVLVINKINKKHINEIATFFFKERIAFNVIPITISGSANNSISELKLEADEFAEPWIQLYDLWFDSEQENYIQISDFVYKTRAMLAGRAASCMAMSQCGNANCSTDPLGNIYPCASLSGHFDLLYGNVNSSSLFELLNTRTALEWRTRKVDDVCSICKWQHICHGGCPSSSYNFFSKNYNKRDYYCPSFLKMYEHIENRLNQKGLFMRIPHTNHMDDGLKQTKAYIESFS